jgi:hypothetical protein
MVDVLQAVVILAVRRRSQECGGCSACGVRRPMILLAFPRRCASRFPLLAAAGS